MNSLLKTGWPVGLYRTIRTQRTSRTARSASTHSLQAGLTVQALGGVLGVTPACPQTSQEGLRAIAGLEGPTGRLRFGTVGSTTLRRPRSNVMRVVSGMAGWLEAKPRR